MLAPAESRTRRCGSSKLLEAVSHSPSESRADRRSHETYRHERQVLRPRLRHLVWFAASEVGQVGMKESVGSRAYFVHRSVTSTLSMKPAALPVAYHSEPASTEDLKLFLTALSASLRTGMSQGRMT